MTGLTRESISKLLASFRDAGWISLSGHSVTLLDIAALERFLSEHDMQRVVRATVSGRGREYMQSLTRTSGPFAIRSAANPTGRRNLHRGR